MEYIFVALASLIHFYIFAMESLLWGRPRTNQVFGMSAESAEQNRLFAFNQGFYNLFLALGATIGLCLGIAGLQPIGSTLMAYSCTSMLGAALVLLYSQRRLIRPALIQGLPPFLALIALAVRICYGR